MKGSLDTLGWVKIPRSDDVLQWANHAKSVADDILLLPDLRHCYRCEDTGIVGVDCLPNDETGHLAGGPEYPETLKAHVPDIPLHAGQVSAIFPGYPKPVEGESEAAARYRIKRDAAHVDGLLPEGADRRRKLKEPHAYILGIPLTSNPSNASPLVVWEKSHLIMRDAFAKAFDGVAPEHWSEVDLTDAYHSARHRCFNECDRVELPAEPGEALLIHRHCLHGMAPWNAGDGPPRIVAYFRPEGPWQDWI
ncbi:MAG: hypothetical protein OXQ92_14710 [Boseongicola sp.]|nr:hypothetical protein [Boseongicola sp.]